PDVEERAPPQQVVPEIDEGEGSAAKHDAGERSGVWRSGAPRDQQRERGGGDRETRERRQADACADQPRALAARREEERRREERHGNGMRRIPRASVDAREEQRGPERRKDRARDGDGARRAERAKRQVEDASRNAPKRPRNDCLRQGRRQDRGERDREDGRQRRVDHAPALRSA